MIFNQLSGNRNTVKPCDYGNKLTSLSSGNGESASWTALKDCWIVGYLQHSTEGKTYLYIDGNVAMSSNGITDSTKVFFNIYVRKGAKITTRNRVNFDAFGCYLI